MTLSDSRTFDFAQCDTEFTECIECVIASNQKMQEDNILLTYPTKL
jgi:hypothetical protein